MPNFCHPAEARFLAKIMVPQTVSRPGALPTGPVAGRKVWCPHNREEKGNENKWNEKGKKGKK